jgi:peptidyl-prolyl cis-trans isomerase C
MKSVAGSLRRCGLTGASRAAVAAATIFLANVAIAVDPSSVIMDSPRARVTFGDYDAEMAKLSAPERAQYSSGPARVTQMLNNIFANRAAAKDARAAGLDTAPVLALQIQLQAERLLAQAQITRVERQAGAAFDARAGEYDARAREIYLTQSERFRTPERVQVAHILTKIGPDGDAAARARADAVRERAVTGTPFADLAREASDDAASRQNGGDLGMMAPSRLDAPIAAAVAALQKPGQISPVVKSTYGYHVIVLIAREPATRRPFADVKPDILAEIRTKFVEEARDRYLQSLFADPPVKVDGPLVEQLGTYYSGTASPSVAVPAAPPR